MKYKTGKREFARLLKEVSNPKTKKIDPALVSKLPDERKQEALSFIQKHRGPIMEILINPLTDRQNLHACGYLYRMFPSGDFSFLCTAENVVKMRRTSAA